MPDVAIITGAAGGMGRACARALGDGRILVLNDLDAAVLNDLNESLIGEGYRVGACVPGDLSAPGVAVKVTTAARTIGRVRAVAHCAGISATMADWRTIVRVNTVATERLLIALEDGLEPGLVAVLMASLAAHRAAIDPEIDRLLAHPLLPDLLCHLETPLQRSASGPVDIELSRAAYHQTKRAVLKTCERRCISWGQAGARIVSISPGAIDTPMGRREATANPAAAAIIGATPIARWGTPGDIAAAVAFLASDDAGFITGCDLKVDGGVIPALAAMQSKGEANDTGMRDHLPAAATLAR